MPLSWYAALADVRHRAGTRLLERAARRLAGETNLELRLRFGEPVSDIEALAATERADLVVVGSRGRSGLRAALLGSVSAGLAASASRPVLIVPKTATGGRLGRFCPSPSSGGTPLAEASQERSDWTLQPRPPVPAEPPRNQPTERHARPRWRRLANAMRPQQQVRLSSPEKRDAGDVPMELVRIPSRLLPR
jgi:hypothetical protein